LDLEHIQKMFFIGIGGIGMSALAKYFHHKGKIVEGYDLHKSSLTQELIDEGIDIQYEESITALPDYLQQKDDLSSTVVVYTPAIGDDNTIYNYVLESGYTLMKRAQLLGLLTDNANTTIAVSGTHGKTTTTSMIAHILNEANIDCTVFLGGTMQDGKGNLQIGLTDDVMVVEADEYDRSFLTLHPDIAVITSLDLDHIDVYENSEELKKAYNQFIGQIRDGGKLFYKAGLDLEISNKIDVNSYSSDHTGMIHATNVTYRKGAYIINYVGQNETIEEITLNISGSFNVENAVAAISVAQQLNVNPSTIKNAMASFPGVKRRFEYLFKSDQTVYIDDYAHHPQELKSCISSVRETFPNRKITGIFQPHLYSRTSNLMQEFAESLSLLDELILLEIYPAREAPIEGVTSEKLLGHVTISEKEVIQKEVLIANLEKRELDVLITLGAGDISQLAMPIAKMLRENQQHD